MQNDPRLPFYFYHRLGNVKVAEHWHQGIEINCLVKGRDLRFAVNGHTFHFNSGDVWVVNRNLIHSSSGEKGDWEYFGLIIDDDFLVSEFPPSKNWNLNLLGQKSIADPEAYACLVGEVKKIDELMLRPFTEVGRLKILSHFFNVIVLLDQFFNEEEKGESPLETGLVNEVITFIQDNFARDLSAESISRHFHISQMTLNK
ncbi:hypothetical protein lacNasYZ03_00980 [Lactobacillus nasalidis]|uniref:HTH araC/xylS-type domain-containing protein n=1 Tax=Lactobacillus nasalidis TaxID=2797258 RepID=A0ABQ3W4M3_9LACO|nr:hypothetical protein lacNasYZ03_00980 [Lactobacillus nasalidis]